MIYHTFAFHNLPAHKLLPHLIDFIEQSSLSYLPWHPCWLNNDGQQVIGLLPKTSWTAYSSSDPVSTTLKQSNLNIEILKTSRQDSDTLNSHYDRYGIDHQSWIEELTHYCNQSLMQQQSSNSPLACYPSGTAFHSGLMGFIGYDIGARALAASPEIEVANQPCAFLGHYDVYLKPCSTQGWELHTESLISQAVKDTIVFYLQQFDERLLDLLQHSVSAPALPLTALWSAEQYAQAFTQTQQYLYHGDSYQINLTQKWQGKLATSADCALSADNFDQNPSLVDYLPDLHQNTEAPFAGYLALTHSSHHKPLSNNTEPLVKNTDANNNATAGNDTVNYNLATNCDPSFHLGFELLSCSPELFVLFNKTESGDPSQPSKPQIITKPIKGTLPRGATKEQDEQLKQQLAQSEKDKAENVMIVDLLRNDLGKYAEVGSVKVPKLFAIESFSNVHHMVSTITAVIKKEHHPLTVLFNSLPAGSITGTPKKRAVEIISELEVAPRGAYCGTLGFFNFDGTGQWSVLIRSLQADSEGQVSLWAGGGITVGSNCDSEYQECHDKVGNLLAILDPKV